MGHVKNIYPNGPVHLLVFFTQPSEYVLFRGYIGAVISNDWCSKRATTETSDNQTRMVTQFVILVNYGLIFAILPSSKIQTS